MKIKNYHADNGRFAGSKFAKSITTEDQGITYCGVGAHHQNGISGYSNRLIPNIGRTDLLYALRYWPEQITTMFWPYAIKMTCDRLNTFALDENGISPEEYFHGIKRRVDVKDFHTPFCPIFVLDERLQGRSRSIPKWEPHSRVGIYFERSPNYARNRS